MLFTQHGVSWENDFSIHLQRGSCCVKETYFVTNGNGEQAKRFRWIIDTVIPVFTDEGRKYIEDRINFEDGD